MVITIAIIMAMVCLRLLVSTGRELLLLPGAVASLHRSCKWCCHDQVPAHIQWWCDPTIHSGGQTCCYV